MCTPFFCFSTVFVSTMRTKQNKTARIVHIRGNVEPPIPETRHTIPAPHPERVVRPCPCRNLSLIRESTPHSW